MCRHGCFQSVCACACVHLWVCVCVRQAQSAAGWWWGRVRQLGPPAQAFNFPPSPATGVCNYYGAGLGAGMEVQTHTHTISQYPPYRNRYHPPSHTPPTNSLHIHRHTYIYRYIHTQLRNTSASLPWPVVHPDAPCCPGVAEHLWSATESTIWNPSQLPLHRHAGKYPLLHHDTKYGFHINLYYISPCDLLWHLKLFLLVFLNKSITVCSEDLSLVQPKE